MPTTFIALASVSVANGGTTVTVAGQSLTDVVFAGDMLLDLAQPLVPPQRVATDAVGGTFELAVGWPGTGLTADPAEVRFTSDAVRTSERTRQLLEQLSVVQANGRGLFYRFDDGTADADPGAGRIRLNDLTIGSSTAAYIDVLDANGATMGDVIDSWDDSGGSADRGQLWLRSIADPAAFHAFRMTDSVVDGTGYRKLTLEYVGGLGSFADGDELMLMPPAKGNQGAAFAYSGEAEDPDDLAAFEGEADGYRVFVLDLGATEFGSYAGRSGVVEWNGSDTWTLIAIYTGPKGDQGNQGWTALYAEEADGERIVMVLDSYVGGEGDAPTDNIGEYLKADGTFTAVKAEAADRRGLSVNWRGAYSGATAYAKRDAVRDQGASWIALQATTGNAPPALPITSNAYWEVMALPGANGAGTVADVVAGTGIDVDATDPTAPVVRVEQAVLDDIDSKIGFGAAIVAALIFS